jgi:uncharacterized alkaline shock family protein YloU
MHGSYDGIGALRPTRSDGFRRYDRDAMEGRASISSDILANYAADAAREVPGVVALADSPLPRRGGVRVETENGRVTVELRLEVAWGASIPDLGRAVQARVGDYLRRMADLEPAAVNVHVDEIRPPAGR